MYGGEPLKGMGRGGKMRKTRETAGTKPFMEKLIHTRVMAV